MHTSPAPRSDGGGEMMTTPMTNVSAEKAAATEAPTAQLVSAESAAATEAPTAQLVGASVGDRCATCGSPLASDQSYCLNCGERRGKARFSFANMTAPKPAATPPRRRDPRRPRFSSSATLIAGIGTLLLAMGVGVLIGDLGKNNKATPAAASPQVITVQGGAGGGTGTAVKGSTHGATPSASSHHSSTKPTKQQHTKVFNPNKTVVITKKVQQQATQAASKVLGSGGNLAGNATSTVGSGCANGQAGCQKGKFTGNFWPGG